jgi:hypothetical protein
MAFIETTQAWKIADEIISMPNITLVNRFVGAQIIYKKI